MTDMDAVICDALRRLECAPEVEFNQVLVPTSTLNGVYMYTVPPNGDLVTLLTVRGSAIREVSVKMLGEVVHTSTDTPAEIPVFINLLRLGYHRATIKVTGADVGVTITFKLLSDIAERRRIATTEPFFTTCIPSEK